MDQEDLYMYQTQVNGSSRDLAALVFDPSRTEACEVFHSEDGACANGNKND